MKRKEKTHNKRKKVKLVSYNEILYTTGDKFMAFMLLWDVCITGNYKRFIITSYIGIRRNKQLT